MAYGTSFKGELKFITELTPDQLAKVELFLTDDCYDHPEWEAIDDWLCVDLEFLPNYSGLKWNNGEKTYGMVEVVNMIIRNMRKTMPEFGFTGKFLAQGEDINDRWELVIENGYAVKKVLS